MKKSLIFIVLFSVLALGGILFFHTYVALHQKEILNQIITRLEADTRVAEVLVTEVAFDAERKKELTTIKFLEYDAVGRPMQPKYFQFAGNIIQFQTLVVRFDDAFVRAGDSIRGKSAYLFWKVFALDGKDTEEFKLIEVNEVPKGYQTSDMESPFEQKFWRDFWSYALDGGRAEKDGIKNAQIEAPGSKFVPGYLYTIRIEHDGGLRIDAQRLSPILRGETL